jgi:hypothetical protein
VFPTDTAVPITAVARLWAQTRGIDPAQTAADLDRLALAGVLQREADGIGFHDLQHDYLVLHAPPLAGLHAALVAAYRAVVPAEPSPWWRLPDGEPYVFDHIVTHLARAGDRAAVAAAVTDPAYLARRITTGGVHGAEADLAAAAALLPDPAVGWLRGWLRRHAHLLAVEENAVPTTLRAWLTADPDTARHGVDPARLEPLLTRPRLDVRWGLAPRPEPLVRVVQADGPSDPPPGHPTARCSPPAATARCCSGTRPPGSKSAASTATTPRCACSRGARPGSWPARTAAAGSCAGTRPPAWLRRSRCPSPTWPPWPGRGTERGCSRCAPGPASAAPTHR